MRMGGLPDSVVSVMSLALDSWVIEPEAGYSPSSVICSRILIASVTTVSAAFALARTAHLRRAMVKVRLFRLHNACQWPPTLTHPAPSPL